MHYRVHMCVCALFFCMCLQTVFVYVCVLPWSPHSLSPPQPYVPTEEEQMAPLPPNPFSELSEKELNDYRKNVERRQLGLSGKTHKHTHVNKPETHIHTPVQMCMNTRVWINWTHWCSILQILQEPNHTERHMDYTHTQWHVLKAKDLSSGVSS